MASFSAIVDKTFTFEGGYQAYANDTANYCGGALIGTNRGISAVAYKEYYGTCPTVAQIKALTKTQAKAIYKKLFWDKIRGDEIANQSVAHIFFDAYIASGGYGLKRVKKYVNQYYGTTKIALNYNPLTTADITLINAANAKQLFDIAKAGEIAHRQSLAQSNPAQYAMFLNGWLNRLNTIVYSASEIISDNKNIVLLLLIGVAVVGTAKVLT